MDELEYQPYQVRRASISELKHWLVCGLFGALLGVGMAYNLGDAFAAAGDFVRGADASNLSRMTLGADAWSGASAAAPRALAASGASGRLDVFPSGVLRPATADAAALALSELSPGARLAARGRVEGLGVIAQ